MFKIHNQTVNIWTHLIPLTWAFFVLFVLITFEMTSGHYLGKSLVSQFVEPYLTKNDIKCRNKEMNQYLDCLEKSKEDKQNCEWKNDEKRVSTWPLVFNVLGAAFCLGCSVTYHLLKSTTKCSFIDIQKYLYFQEIWILLELVSTLV